MTDDDKSKGLARVESWAMALEPKDDAAVRDRAERAHRMGICNVRSVDDAITRIEAGRTVGFSWMQSLQYIDIIKGMPALRSKARTSLCKSHRSYEYLELVESTDTSCTYKAKRKGEGEQTLTYTIKDAQKAGLASSPNYTKQPKAMLRARCAGQLCDVVWPDACMGMYSVEELDPGTLRIDDIEVTPMPSAVAVRVAVGAPEPPPSDVQSVDVRDAEYEEADDPANDLPPEMTLEELEQSFMNSIALASSKDALDSAYHHAKYSGIDEAAVRRINVAVNLRLRAIKGKKAG